MEDVEVLYEKLAVGQPILLVQVACGQTRTVQTLTAEHPSTCICNAPLRPGDSRQAELWSLAEEPSTVEVPQGICLACGRRYLGTWSYKTGVGPSQWQDVLATSAAHKGQYVYLANHRRVVVFTRQVMRLVLSCLDNCKGSFSAVAQLLADVTCDPGYAWKRRTLTSAYVIYGLSMFLNEQVFTGLSWPGDVFSASEMDGFLRELGKTLTSVLTVRWGVEHRCELCEGGFLLGADGKHGARRYTCAWKDVGTESVPALGGIAIRRPCANRAVLGSIFCREHSGREDVAESQAAEEANTSQEATVLRCRRGALHQGPLIADAPEPEYEVKVVGADGAEEVQWRKASQISPVLLRAFEEGRAADRAHQAQAGVRKHRGENEQGVSRRACAVSCTSSSRLHI